MAPLRGAPLFPPIAVEDSSHLPPKGIRNKDGYHEELYAERERAVTKQPTT